MSQTFLQGRREPEGRGLRVRWAGSALALLALGALILAASSAQAGDRGSAEASGTLEAGVPDRGEALEGGARSEGTPPPEAASPEADPAGTPLALLALLLGPPPRRSEAVPSWHPATERL